MGSARRSDYRRARWAIRLCTVRATSYKVFWSRTDPELRPRLKKAGLLTRDSREKERKKYGLKRARKAEQYSKR